MPIENKFESFIKRTDVAKDITIGYQIGDDTQLFGDCNLMYDLASLTKVFGGVLIIKLQELGKLSLEDRVGEYIDYDIDVSIKELMIHKSGLRDEMLEIENQTVKIRLGDNQYPKITSYADINYILLYMIVSTFGDYQSLLKQYVTTDLDIVYRPSAKGLNFAPTECRSDRGLVCGQVHDNKAFMMGEVSAHAGLFANMNGLINFFSRLVNGEIVDVKTILEKDDKRNLLFEITNSKKQMGEFDKIASFHTGFTGTSVLIDFEQKNFIVILTNRIYPTRTNERIFEFRKQVHNQYYKQCQGRKK